MDEQKARPCPFCGNTGVTVWKLPREAVEEGCGRWIVKCVDGCSISIDGYISREAALRAWNRRPIYFDPLALEREIAKLTAERDGLREAAQDVLRSHGTGWRYVQNDGKLHRDVDCDCPACASLRAAIAKATGTAVEVKL